jgi:hypothetical protein
MSVPRSLVRLILPPAAWAHGALFKNLMLYVRLKNPATRLRKRPLDEYRE